MSYKISIITPSYNQGEFIEDTIVSVKDQDNKNFEHIIVDGGSRDGTIEILKKYDHLNWISEKDKGQSDAINKGFMRATGDILAWQNSDDYYMPSAFNFVVAYFEKHPECMMLYGDCLIVDRQSKILFTLFLPEWNFQKFIAGRFCPLQPAVFFRAEVLEVCGLIDQSLHYVMDVDLFARIALRYRIDHVPKILGAFRAHDNGKTTNMRNRLALWKEFDEVIIRYTTRDILLSISIYYYRVRSLLGYYYKRYCEKYLLFQRR